MNAESLAHLDLDRLRPFVRALLRNPEDADDVVQETWIRAAERMPAGLQVEAAQAWARRTAERLVWNRHRSRSRRMAREQDHARPEGEGPEPHLDLQRIEELQHVLSALEALPEIERRAVTLRYFEGQRGAALARSLGCETAAARQRVHRGLERLRAAMDRRHGGERRAWAGVLAPLAIVPAGARTLVAAALVVVGGVGVGLAVALTPGGAGAPGPPTQLAQEGAAPAVVESEAGQDLPSPVRTAAVPDSASAPASAGAEPATALGPAIVSALAVSARPDAFTFEELGTGASVPGLEVRALTDEGRLLEGASDAGGRVEFDLTSGERVTELVARKAGFTTLHHRPRPFGELPPLLLRREQALGGTVLDATGLPVGAGVAVEVSLAVADDEGALDFDYLDDGSAPGLLGRLDDEELQRGTRIVSTDAKGRFSISAPETQRQAELAVRAPALGSESWRLGDSEVVAELSAGAARLAFGPAELRAFEIVDRAGAPVVGARVRQVGDDKRPGDARFVPEVRTDAAGRAELAIDSDLEPWLWIDAPGFALEPHAIDKRIVLRAGHDLLVQVYDASGTPVPGVLVELEPYPELRAEVERRTGEDGQARFARLPNELIEVAVKSAAFRDMEPYEHRPSSGPLVVALVAPLSFEVDLAAGFEPELLDDLQLVAGLEAWPEGWTVPLSAERDDTTVRTGSLEKLDGPLRLTLVHPEMNPVELGPFEPNHGLQQIRWSPESADPWSLRIRATDGLAQAGAEVLPITERTLPVRFSGIPYIRRPESVFESGHLRLEADGTGQLAVPHLAGLVGAAVDSGAGYGFAAAGEDVLQLRPWGRLELHAADLPEGQVLHTALAPADWVDAGVAGRLWFHQPRTRGGSTLLERVPTGDVVLRWRIEESTSLSSLSSLPRPTELPAWAVVVARPPIPGLMTAMVRSPAPDQPSPLGPWSAAREGELRFTLEPGTLGQVQLGAPVEDR